MRKQHSHGGPRRIDYVPDHGDDQILTIPEWATLAGISLHTAYRNLHGPNPPATVKLSANRIGISRRAHRAWLAARERPAVVGGRV